jgi:hypothetical protein
VQGNYRRDRPRQGADLLSLLHAVIKDDQEEVRLRALFLVKKYGQAFDDLKARPSARPKTCGVLNIAWLVVGWAGRVRRLSRFDLAGVAFLVNGLRIAVSFAGFKLHRFAADRT